MHLEPRNQLQDREGEDLCCGLKPLAPAALPKAEAVMLCGPASEKAAGNPTAADLCYGAVTFRCQQEKTTSRF